MKSCENKCESMTTWFENVSSFQGCLEKALSKWCFHSKMSCQFDAGVKVGPDVPKWFLNGFFQATELMILTSYGKNLRLNADFFHTNLVSPAANCSSSANSGSIKLKLSKLLLNSILKHFTLLFIFYQRHLMSLCLQSLPEDPWLYQRRGFQFPAETWSETL